MPAVPTRAARPKRKSLWLHLAVTAALTGVCTLPARADLRADVDCVARLVGVPPPAKLPAVAPVSQQDLARFLPTGWTRDTWAKRGRGVFVPPALILLADDRWLGHELAHFVLHAAGQPSGHDDSEAHRKVIFAGYKFRVWCRR